MINHLEKEPNYTSYSSNNTVAFGLHNVEEKSQLYSVIFFANGLYSLKHKNQLQLSNNTHQEPI